jgi:hypothetical protein
MTPFNKRREARNPRGSRRNLHGRSKRGLGDDKPEMSERLAPIELNSNSRPVCSS